MISSMKTNILVLLACGVSMLSLTAADIGMRVIPPSERGYTVDAIRESGERGGLLHPAGTNFTAAYNKEMGDAMELWNVHRYQEARQAFERIRQEHPDSPWAAEAELHEGCFAKFNNLFDEAEEHFLNLLSNYPQDREMRRKVLHYLPQVYGLTSRYATALDTLQELQTLEPNWQERQYIENYQRIFGRLYQQAERDRRCGTKALALALAATNATENMLNNTSLASVFKRYPWALTPAANPEGYSLKELAGLCGGEPVSMDYAQLKSAARRGSPVLAYLTKPPEAKWYQHNPKRHFPKSIQTGHFVIVEQATDDAVELLDPSGGRLRLAADAFKYRWAGAVLRLPGQSGVEGTPLSDPASLQMRGGCCGIAAQDPSDEPDCKRYQVNGAGGKAGGCTTCGARAGSGAPIYRFGLASANFILNDSPMWLPPANGPEMAIRLVYNRVATDKMATYQNNNYYCFGNKWTMNYCGYVMGEPGGNINVVLPGARMENFYWDSYLSEYYPVDERSLNTLVVVGDQYKFTSHDSKESYYFSTDTAKQQRLEKIEDRYGTAIVLSYSTEGNITSIVDSQGRSFNLTYSSGYVTNISDNFHRSCTFEYEDGNLTAITDMGGFKTQIQYDANNWATNITYPNSSAYKVEYTDTNLYPSDTNGTYYSAPFRMRVVDSLNQTNEYFYHAISSMGPATVTDKSSNTWAYLIENNYRGYYSYSQDITYDIVNPHVEELTGQNSGYLEYQLFGQQWEYRQFSVNADLVQVSSSLIDTPTATQMSYFNYEPAFTTDGLNKYYSYDNRHNQIQADLYGADTLLGTWSYGYDDSDNLTWITNALNQITYLEYDNKDQLTSIVNPLNQETVLSYDAQGNLLSIQDPLLNTTSWDYYNGFNTKAQYPEGLVLYKAPDLAGRVGSITDNATPVPLQVQFNYDDLDRVSQITYLSDNTKYNFTYSCCGLSRAVDRLGRTNAYGYDVLGRMSSVTNSLGQTVQFRYNAANQISNIITRVGQADRIKQFKYAPENGSSRLKQIVTPLGKTNGFGYTFRGNLKTQTNAYGTIQYGYDVQERLTNVILPGSVTHTIAYKDVLGNVSNVTSAIASYAYDQYDALNRATHLNATLSVPGFTNVQYGLSYQYDAAGRLTNRTVTGLGTNLQATYVYDAMNHLASVTETVTGFPSTTVAYQYDTPGRLLWKTYGNNDTVEYRYDGESRLSGMTVKNGSTTLTNYVYARNAMGNILSIISTNGARTDYAYDAGDQLIRETLPNNGGVNEWDYDTVGNALTIRLPGSSTGYLYNNDDELTEASGQTTITGTVNGGSGNNKWYNSWAECRGVRARVNTGNGSFTLPGVPVYVGTNALQVKVTDASGNTNVQTRTVTKASGNTTQYDGDGNMLSRQTSQGAWTNTWNVLNQLLTVSSNGVVVLQNWYDSFGRRIAKLEVIGGTTNKWLYVYDGWSVVAVLNGASGLLVESYTRGLGLAGDVGTLVAARHHSGSWSGQTIYLHANHRGDVVMARNGTSTVGTYEYAPFGTQRTVTGTYNARFRFSSKELDASAGLYCYGYRFYDPNLQRWLNRDPLANGAKPLGLRLPKRFAKGPWEMVEGPNVYSFNRNNSINYVDVNGLWTFGIGIQGMAEWFGVGGGSLGFYFGRNPNTGCWSVGILLDVLGGIGGPSSFGGAVFGQYTNADSVNQLQGWGAQVGGSVGGDLTLTFGGDYVVGFDSNGITYQGVQVSGGYYIGLPVEVHGVVTLSGGVDAEQEVK